MVGNHSSLVFSYYSTGVHLANFIISEDCILYQIKNEVNLEWGEYSQLTEENNSFRFPEDIPVLSLPDKLKTSVIDEGYKRYLKVSGEVNGVNTEGYIWAQSKGAFPQDYLIVDNQLAGIIQTSPGGINVLVKQGYEALTPVAMFSDPLISKPEYGIKFLGTFQVKMKDGINLATDIILPSDLPDGVKVPAILIRTCYGKANQKSKYFYARYGYAVIIQDVRGREESEGEWSPNVNEISDGGDTLDWIADQSWCDGNIGMIGPSYLGYVQWAAAANGNPHLKALISQVNAGSPFIDVPRKGGALLSGMLAWSFAMADRKINVDAFTRDDWDEVLEIRPIKQIPSNALGKEVPFWNEWIDHENNDEYWKKADWSLHEDKINVPALLISGWYDDNGEGTSQAWAMNKKNMRQNQKMILGPWRHRFNVSRDIHNIQFGLNAIRYDLEYQYIRWFDHFLKGIENGVKKEPSVDYYVVGENVWKQDSDWPPVNSSETGFYFHSNGNANASIGDGALKLEKPGKQIADQYIFDPKNPAPHLIDMSENELAVPENYKDMELREDVLIFTSEPLKEDLEVAGELKAVLYAASSARDTDWVIRLTDVDEEGNSIRLSDGLIRARYRESFSEPKLLEPFKVEKYVIKMSKIANIFKKGHCIRVQVTSGAKNYIFPNPNTGNKVSDDTETIVAIQKVYHDAEYPSHVVLPVAENV